MTKHSHIRGEIHIGRNVYLGTNVIITKPITIGDGAVIAAGSIVNKDVPSHSIVAGNPAKIIRTGITMNERAEWSNWAGLSK
jgi:acetyltransferase-like isoleucine patch superfamily enzyme